MNAAIHIGNTEESVKQFAEGLVNILSATHASDLVKYLAIQALRDKMHPTASISHCNFTMAPANDNPKYDEDDEF